LEFLMPYRFAAAMAAISVFASLSAQDWPAWRGPSGDGLAAADARPPVTWSEEQNVRWKVPLPGAGASTPIVWGDRIYLTTAVDTGRPGAPDTTADPGADRGATAAPSADTAQPNVHEFVVLAFSRDGEPVWRTEVGEAAPPEKGHDTGTYASASVVTDGEHVVAFFGSNGLYCLDPAGEVLWRKQLGRQTTLAGFGEGASPALSGTTLVVPWDHEGASFVAAFDVRTGDELWRQDRSTDSSWGTPVVIAAGDAQHVLLTGSKQTLAYDLASGVPVWSCGGMSSNPVVGPTVADGILFVMNSYKGNVVQAIRLEGAAGDITESGIVWTQARNAAYVPMPLVHAGLLYFLRDSTGVLSCVDARTGEVQYEGQRLGLRRIHSSPMGAAGHLYFTDRGGVTQVVKAGPEFELVATNRLDAVIDASFVAVGRDLLVRGRSHLYCLNDSE